MGLWSWLFPNQEERLRRVRAKMAAGDYESARKAVMRVKGDEAEALYAECSKHIDVAEKIDVKKKLAAEGFHGWRIDVSARGQKRKTEIEKLVRAELEKVGFDLDLPEMDEAEAKKAVARVQRKIIGAGREPVEIRLVPLLDQRSAGSASRSGDAKLRPKS
jgi:hypothetical protein